MGTVIEDAKEASSWIATALSSSGYAADFSPASLREIDRFFDDQAQGGVAKPGGLLSQHLGARLFAVGAYIGEVIRRERGGEWVAKEYDPEAELNIAVRLPDGSTFWPMQRALKRFKNGPEDGIAAYGAGILSRSQPVRGGPVASSTAIEPRRRFGVLGAVGLAGAVGFVVIAALWRRRRKAAQPGVAPDGASPRR
jgi:hypothetical protein